MDGTSAMSQALCLRAQGWGGSALSPETLAFCLATESLSRSSTFGFSLENSDGEGKEWVRCQHQKEDQDKKGEFPSLLLGNLVVSWLDRRFRWRESQWGMTDGADP